MWNVLSALFIAVFLPILSLFNFLRSLDFNSSGCTTYSTWYFLVSEIDNWFHSLIELNSWCERNWISDYKPNMHFRTSVHIMWYASNVASSNNSSNNKNTATKKTAFISVHVTFESILFSSDFRLELNGYISNARNHHGYVEFAIQLHANSFDFLFIYFTKYHSCFAMCIVSFCLYFCMDFPPCIIWNQNLSHFMPIKYMNVIMV